MQDYLDELQTWWQSLGADVHANIRMAGILFVAAIAGHWLGKWTARFLAGRNFDAALRAPGSSPAAGSGSTPADGDHGITPTFLAGMLVRLTVWALGASSLAAHWGRSDVVERIGLVLSRTWAMTGILVVTLALASILARRLVDFFHEAKPGNDGSTFGLGTASSRSGIAGGVAAGVYFLVGLLVLLVAADMFNWPLTRASAEALWQLAQKLLTVGATILIGLLGARWARELVAEPAATPEKRVGQYTSLGILGIAVLLSLSVLLSNASILLGLGLFAVLGAGLWLARGYFPDIAAGLQLRTRKVREVWFDGVAWQVAEVGFLTTHLCREGAVHAVQNRIVLEARVQETPAELSARQPG